MQNYIQDSRDIFHVHTSEDIGDVSFCFFLKAFVQTVTLSI